MLHVEGNKMVFAFCGDFVRCLIQNDSTGAVLKYAMENYYTCTKKEILSVAFL